MLDVKKIVKEAHPRTQELLKAVLELSIAWDEKGPAELTRAHAQLDLAETNFWDQHGT